MDVVVVGECLFRFIQSDLLHSVSLRVLIKGLIPEYNSMPFPPCARWPGREEQDDVELLGASSRPSQRHRRHREHFDYNVEWM
jgi:hypothetical protein